MVPDGVSNCVSGTLGMPGGACVGEFHRCFQGIFKEFQGVFRMFFPMLCPGMPLDPDPNNFLFWHFRILGGLVGLYDCTVARLEDQKAPRVARR